MPWAIPLAIAGSAVVGAVASNSAANKQADAANRATDVQLQMHDQNRADLAPWRASGQQALGRLADLMGVSNNTGAQGYGSLGRNFTLADFQADPGYQFRLDQGTRGIQNTAAARGSLMSGATLKALSRFNQNTASDEFGNAYNRFNNNQNTQYNRLNGLASMGENASAQTANMGTQVAGQVGQNMIGAGNALAAGQVGGANAINSGVSNYLSYNTNQALLNRLAPTSSSYNGSGDTFGFGNYNWQGA
jgi:hypothetical protein